MFKLLHVPDDRQLDEWGAWAAGEVGAEYGRMPHLAAFLRSPALREALRTQEAVEWMYKQVRDARQPNLRGFDITLPGNCRTEFESDLWLVVDEDGTEGWADTLHEAVTRLRASRPEKEERTCDPSPEGENVKSQRDGGSAP